MFMLVLLSLLQVPVHFKYIGLSGFYIFGCDRDMTVSQLHFNIDEDVINFFNEQV